MPGRRCLNDVWRTPADVIDAKPLAVMLGSNDPDDVSRCAQPEDGPHEGRTSAGHVAALEDGRELDGGVGAVNWRARLPHARGARNHVRAEVWPAVLFLQLEGSLSAWHEFINYVSICVTGTSREGGVVFRCLAMLAFGAHSSRC
jgi:hypothetical protein